MRDITSFKYSRVFPKIQVAAEIYYDYLGCKLEQRLIVANKETIAEYQAMIQKGDISGDKALFYKKNHNAIFISFISIEFIIVYIGSFWRREDLLIILGCLT